MANWDVFHGDRLELERGLTTSAIREALARGELLRRRPGSTGGHDRRLDAVGRHAPTARAGRAFACTQPPCPAARGEPAVGAEPAVPAVGPRRLRVSGGRFRARCPCFLRPRSHPAEHPTGSSCRPNPMMSPSPSSRTSRPSRNTLRPTRKPRRPRPASGWRWADDGDDEDQEEEDDDFVERHDDRRGNSVRTISRSLTTKPMLAPQVAFAVVAETG